MITAGCRRGLPSRRLHLAARRPPPTDHAYAGLALAALATMIVILVIVPRNLEISPGDRGLGGYHRLGGSARSPSTFNL